ncbi:hypothetical protein E3N88_32512 [Mikania micrantha]|uniref:Uncharacterized protein n=1 Tax=Mikania micrantha TaxID=192012 RepID=A0A5N6M987_9ASTR|nr:hypothetical protein E3N88_32512 [Mikania micrantha]
MMLGTPLASLFAAISFVELKFKWPNWHAKARPCHPAWPASRLVLPPLTPLYRVFWRLLTPSSIVFHSHLLSTEILPFAPRILFQLIDYGIGFGQALDRNPLPVASGIELMYATGPNSAD